ncbi:MAG: hypothetical protein WC527_08190 [Candidatus Margulisiibacteriota bacterium]
MTEKELSLSDALAFGWNAMKTNLWFFVVTFLILVVITCAQSLLTSGGSFVSFIFLLAFYAINLIVGMGIIKISLKLVDGQKPEYSDLYSSYPLFWSYLGGSILFGIMACIGYMLLIIPGIIISLQFGLFGYLVVDKGSAAISSLQQSSKVTNGAKWKLFGLALLSIFINIVGLLCLGIGLIATIPTTIVAWAYAYRKLLAQTSI